MDHPYEVGRFGDDGICHARLTQNSAYRCYLPRRDHKETSVIHRIEDMAPGTKFTAESTGKNPITHRFTVKAPGALGVVLLSCDDHRTGAYPHYVDPTTIRDVVLPTAEPVESTPEASTHQLVVHYLDGTTQNMTVTQAGKTDDGKFLWAVIAATKRTRTINLSQVQYYEEERYL